MIGRFFSYTFAFVTGIVFLLSVVVASEAAPPAPGKTKDDVPRISVDEFKTLMDEGADIFILDVRTRGSYVSSKLRIPGDIRVEGKGDLKSKADSIDRAAEIITYCT